MWIINHTLPPMSVIPCHCPTPPCLPIQVDRSTVLQLRARPCDTVDSGANVAWILHWAELHFFPSECRPLQVRDAVQAHVLGTALEGTVTKLTSTAIQLTLVNTFLVNTLGNSLVVTLHVVRGNICSATSSATGAQYRYHIIRPDPAQCNPLPPLLDVQWQQTGTVEEHLYPMVQEGAGEHRILNGVDTYYITEGEQDNTLVLYNRATGTDNADTDNSLTMLPLDEVDPAGWLEFYDAATGELLASQSAAFNHDSNKIPIPAEAFAQLPPYDMVDPMPTRRAVKLKVKQTTTVPVGYFVFGNGRRLTIELGGSILEAEPELAYFMYFNQLRHARFSAGTGTLVQQRRIHYKFTPFLGGTEVDKQAFAVVLGGIPFVLGLKSDIGVVVSHNDSGDFALTLANPVPERTVVNFQTGDAVRLKGILDFLSPVSGPALDSLTTYYIKRTGDLIQLFRDAALQTQVQFTDTTASGMPFFLMHEHVAAAHGQHGGEMVVLEDHPEDFITMLIVADLTPGSFNDKSGSYFQVFGDNPSIVVGSKV